MQAKKPEANVGVIVARFQLNALHEMHKKLIETVGKSHARVVIVLGVSPITATKNNPLPFQTRRQMILESYPPSQYPNLSIAHIQDVNSDEIWSEKLDAVIKSELGPNDKVMLYGGRDSFIAYYKGKYNTSELESDHSISATEIRKQIHAAPQADPNFRAGAIWASAQRFPTSYQCVDIAVTEKDNGKVTKILLARKLNETKYRFIGGFVDPTDESLEYSAARELGEETGNTLNVGGAKEMKYVGSFRVDDWRYRNEQDKIMTAFFICNKLYGSAKASDDIAEVRWFPIEELKESLVVNEHKNLLVALAKYLEIELSAN